MVNIPSVPIALYTVVAFPGKLFLQAPVSNYQSCRTNTGCGQSEWSIVVFRSSMDPLGVRKAYVHSRRVRRCHCPHLGGWLSHQTSWGTSMQLRQRYLCPSGYREVLGTVYSGQAAASRLASSASIRYKNKQIFQPFLICFSRRMPTWSCRVAVDWEGRESRQSSCNHVDQIGCFILVANVMLDQAVVVGLLLGLTLENKRIVISVWAEKYTNRCRQAVFAACCHTPHGCTAWVHII